MEQMTYTWVGYKVWGKLPSGDIREFSNFEEYKQTFLEEENKMYQKMIDDWFFGDDIMDCPEDYQFIA